MRTNERLVFEFYPEIALAVRVVIFQIPGLEYAQQHSIYDFLIDQIADVVKREHCNEHRFNNN